MFFIVRLYEPVNQKAKISTICFYGYKLLQSKTMKHGTKLLKNINAILKVT